MRDCRKMIDELKKDQDAFNYIKMLCDNKEEFFVAIRDKYLSVYYLGGSVAKIRFNKKREVVFDVHKKYLGGSEILNDYEEELDKKTYLSISCEKHKDNLELIKDNIKRIALNNKNDCDKENDIHGKISREKMCQQWIINKNNKSDSKWYYIDMENVFE